MTTLTVYFASLPGLSTAVATPTTSTLTTAIPSIRPIPKLTQSLPRIPSQHITSPKTNLMNRSPPLNRKSSKRNKTFFERFSETSSSALISNPQSPPHQQQAQQQQQQQQITDASNPSLEPAPRLRRRFTFRRSLRHSVHNKGGETDDGI
ncbi:unnamed protein product, partial [Adineta ricciae]